MTQSPQHSLQNATMYLFRPLCKILLRNGISWGTFAQWAKKVYVDVAFDDFAEPGKKQTISRVSALTGLFRRDAKRLHEQNDETDDDSSARYNRAVRVISGWINDPEFQNEAGEPAELSIDNDSPSFVALVRKYSGDIPTQAMLTVLRTAGSVTAHDNRLKLVKYAYVPGNDSADKIHILGTDVAELVATIDHNLTAPENDLLFQRKVSNSAVTKEVMAEFQLLAAAKSQALLEELDAWLSEREQRDDSADTGTHYVSLGIYYSEHSTQKG